MTPTPEQLAEAVEQAQARLSLVVVLNVADLETLLSALQAKDAALRQCRDQFAFYAHKHLAAGKETKAVTNQRFADIAAQALGNPTP
jgi:hypothetical protein